MLFKKKNKYTIFNQGNHANITLNFEKGHCSFSSQRKQHPLPSLRFRVPLGFGWAIAHTRIALNKQK